MLCAGQTRAKAPEVVPVRSGSPDDTTSGARPMPIRYSAKKNLNTKALDFF